MMTTMSDADTNIQRCPALRKDGSPCRAKPTASGWCVGHDPQSTNWRVKGGANTTRAHRADKLLPARLRPVADGLMRAFAGVEAGTFDLKRAACMAALASALVRVVQAG